MSWRDETRMEIQDDLDRLLDEALRAAQHLLEKNGEFFPFAVFLDTDGSPVLAAADPGEGDKPPSRAMLEGLQEAAVRQRDGLRAAAFASAVDIEGGEAVRAEVEHRDGGPAVAVFLPYSRQRLRRGIEFGELRAGAAERLVWL
jgi:hypothetical protein